MHKSTLPLRGRHWLFRALDVLRHAVPAVAAAGLAAAASTPARSGEAACRPNLLVTPVGYSQSHTPGGWRTWTVSISADPSRCATLSGDFDVVFAMEKENALDGEVREPAVWRAGPAVQITKQLWIDEAVAAVRIDNIAPCPCRP